MTRFLICTLVVLGLLVVPATSQATILSDFLTFDGPVHHTAIPFQGGGEDKLQDDSVSAFLDLDSSGGFTDGDVVWGIVTLSDVLASGRPSVPVGANSQIAIIFSAMISGVGSAGSINLIPVADATKSYDLRKLVHSSIASASSLDDFSMITIVSTSTPDTTPADDPLNWSSTQTDNLLDGFSTTNGWSWELDAGIVGGDDFFEFVGSLGLGGTDRAALTIQDQAFSVPGGWLPVDVFDYAAVAHKSDFTLDIGTVNIADASQQANGWTFRDQSSFFVNPDIPEPTTLISWALLTGIAGLFVARRRRK